jgi:hypothetical protein
MQNQTIQIAIRILCLATILGIALYFARENILSFIIGVIVGGGACSFLLIAYLFNRDK